MVERIVGFSCRSVLWYQGESDEGRADIYAELFSAVIDCWREAWDEKLPFLFVQLAPYEKSALGSGKNFPLIREGQEWVSKNIESTFMVSIMDGGMKADIHPKHKRPVGERLALMARGKVYGDDVLCEPPEPVDMELLEGGLVLKFANAGDGLCIRGGQLSAFVLFVDGKKVKNFSAKLSRDRVCQDGIEIISPEIKKGAEVEALYAYEGWCQVNLYSSAGLPAKPFKLKGVL